MSTNIDSTKRAYAAFASGDMATLTDLIAPDCVWHVGGRNQLSGVYVGHEQIFGYFGKLLELTAGTFTATMVDVGETEGGLVATLVGVRGKRNGTTLETRSIQLGRSNAAGQLVECWWFEEDEAAADAFLGPAEVRLPRQGAATVSA